MVLNDCGQVQRCRIALYLGANVALPLPKMQCIRLDHPNVTVDARAFVEPSVAEARIHADHQIVFGAIVQEIRDVKAEGCISIVIASDEVAVHEDQGVAEGAIKQ